MSDIYVVVSECVSYNHHSHCDANLTDIVQYFPDNVCPARMDCIDTITSRYSNYHRYFLTTYPRRWGRMSMTMTKLSAADEATTTTTTTIVGGHYDDTPMIETKMPSFPMQLGSR